MNSFKPGRMRAGMAALALAAVASVAAPASASHGGENKAKTKITIKKLTHSGASGTLKSKEEACLKNRKVSLFRLDDYVSVKIKITHSNSKGKWHARRKHLKDGKYFAKVDATKADGVNCLYDVSKSERLK